MPPSVPFSSHWATRTNAPSGPARYGWGFPPGMVRLALGEPSRVVRRTAVSGESLVWDYAYHRPVYEGRTFIGYRFYEVGPERARRTVRVPEYLDQYRYETVPYLRITFRENRVVEIERAQ